MDKEKGNMTDEGLMEQIRFIESFALAMKRIDAARLMRGKGPFKRTAYDEIKDGGNWNAGWLAEQYVLLVARKSALSSRLRKFVARVGYEAKSQYDKKYDNEVKP